MKVTQILCGWVLFMMAVYVFVLGWGEYHSESARFSRILGENLGIGRPFWSQAGVPEMAAGVTGAVVGLLLMVLGLGGPPPPRICGRARGGARPRVAGGTVSACEVSRRRARPARTSRPAAPRS